MLQRFFLCLQSIWKWYSSLHHIPLRHFSSNFFLLQLSAKLYIFLLWKCLLFSSFTLVPAQFAAYGRYEFCYSKHSSFDSFEFFWSFSGKTLHCWHYKKAFCWFCHKVWAGKMDLVEKLITAMNGELPIVAINSFETVLKM